MLAAMSEIDSSDVGVSELPTGTVTLLLADIEGSTRLWETRPDEMTAAAARLDEAVSDAIAVYDGVRPVEQGGGDSFAVAFGRASDAVACAVELQRAPLAPIRLRIGLHTGEVRLRERGSYIGPTINRTARLRDLAHGGQTVLSGATEPLIVDQLPPGASLTDLGTYLLRDLPRPERVVQLCHPDLCNDFPPLRTPSTVVPDNLPVQLTSFIGRQAEISRLRETLAGNRIVTLTGAGGVGKTRLAVQVAAELAGEFGDGVWYVDLASITAPDVVPVTVARALGLPDQPGRSTMDTLLRFIRDRQMLVVLDNCEHLLDASAALVVAVLGAAPRLTVLATSREPIGVTGEATWHVPSLSVADEAIELFADRARLTRAGFTMTDDNAAAVAEICRRLDGMPLAIELAAARVRALSLAEIVDSLRDRFRLLTGGARSAVRRQQTLRASVDWSHALLTEPERVLFRRLAVFLGGFDLDAAQAVAGAGDVERFQVLDQLTLLVDKSLVVADDSRGRTRYRMLETVRQYASEKLGESGEADAVRARHRGHYTALAALLEIGADRDYRQQIERAETEIDNMRAAFVWSRENDEMELALALASSLQPLWLGRGRVQEGLSLFDAVLGDNSLTNLDLAPEVRARALADKALLDATVRATNTIDQAEEALAIARKLDDPALLVRVLTACGSINGFHAEAARSYLAEAINIARALADRWRVGQILARQQYTAMLEGDLIAARAAGEEGRDLADAIGDQFTSRMCRVWLVAAQMMQGNVAVAAAQCETLAAEAEEAHDMLHKTIALISQGHLHAYTGNIVAARAAANAAMQAATEIGEAFRGYAYAALADAALAAGDVAAAQEASKAGWQPLTVQHTTPQVALARGDVIEARRWADDAVSATTGWHLMMALLVRARVTIAQGEPDQAGRDAYNALTCAEEIESHLAVPDILECLASLTADAGSHREAVRLLGAADAIRKRIGLARFKIYEPDHQALVAVVRDALGEQHFSSAWAEGAALSTEEAITYARRGRGERKRPASGWASLTPAERDVVRLIREGLTNKDVATRLFVSPRTVQTHLTHVYAKLRLTSRVQLVQEAARHA